MSLPVYYNLPDGLGTGNKNPLIGRIKFKPPQCHSSRTLMTFSFRFGEVATKQVESGGKQSHARSCRFRLPIRMNYNILLERCQPDE